MSDLPTTIPPANDEPVNVADVIRRLGPAAYLAAGAVILPLVGSVVLFSYLDTVAIWFRNQGPQGLVLYAYAFALLAGLAMLPSYSSAILGGWTFGFTYGYPAALFGFSMGALLGYYICSFTTKDRVEKMIESNPKMLAVRNALVGSGFWRTFGIVFLLRVPPNSPFAITNLALASVQARVGPVFLGTLLGMAPRTAFAVWLAAKFREQSDSLETTPGEPWWVWPVAIVLYVIVAMIIGTIAKRALKRFTDPVAIPPAK